MVSGLVGMAMESAAKPAVSQALFHCLPRRDLRMSTQADAVARPFFFGVFEHAGGGGFCRFGVVP